MSLRRFISITAILFISNISLLPTSANAEQGYRYWGYFQAPSGTSQWKAALTGPSTKLNDGDVEGWAFSVSTNDIPASAPNMDPDFQELCGSTSAVAGKIRVGLVVDFGGIDIAPTGETPKEFFQQCVLVTKNSTGMDVLQAALPVRTGSSGLICGIGGYPASECSPTLELPLPTPTPMASPLIATAPVEKSGNSLLSNRNIAIGAALIFALVVSLIAIRRKR